MNIYLISSLFVFSSLFSADSKEPFPSDSKLQPMTEAELLKMIDSELLSSANSEPLIALDLQQILAAVPKNPPLRGETLNADSFMDKDRAQEILDGVVEHVQIQMLPCKIANKIMEDRPAYNATILRGRPGVGKTTIMKAVATLVGPEWTPVMISESDINKDAGKRNASTAAFCEIVRQSRIKNKNSLFMVNEFHGWLEHYGSEHHDTDVLSHEIQNFLDDCRNNTSVFFMATVNDFDKVPEPIKNRLENCIFEINGYADQETSTREFLKFLDSSRYILNAEEREYLIHRYVALAIRDPRLSFERAANIKSQASGRCMKADRRTTIFTIDKIDIDYVMTNVAVTRAAIKVGQKIETDAERSQRMHDELRDDNKKYFEANKKMHDEDVGRQQEQRREDLERHAEEHNEDVKRAEFNQLLSMIGTGSGVISAAPAAMAVGAAVAPAVIAAAPYVGGAAVIYGTYRSLPSAPPSVSPSVEPLAQESGGGFGFRRLFTRFSNIYSSAPVPVSPLSSAPILTPESSSIQ